MLSALFIQLTGYAAMNKIQEAQKRLISLFMACTIEIANTSLGLWNKEKSENAMNVEWIFHDWIFSISKMAKYGLYWI